MVGAFVRDRAPDRARARALDALERVGLRDRASLVPTGLTTLELRLMELARCLATGPRLVLLDEPLAGLSSDGVELMSTMIRLAPAAGITVAGTTGDEWPAAGLGRGIGGSQSGIRNLRSQ